MVQLKQLLLLLLLLLLLMDFLQPQNNPVAAFYVLFPDVKLYFDSECNDSGTWILKITNLPGDVVGMIRDKEKQLYENNKGKYVCSTLIERTSYKLMIEIKLSKNFIIIDEHGVPIKPGEMYRGDVYTLQTYAKEWRVRHRLGYTFHAESAVLKMRAQTTKQENNKPHGDDKKQQLETKKSTTKRSENKKSNNQQLENNKEISISSKQFKKLMQELDS